MRLCDLHLTTRLCVLNSNRSVTACSMDLSSPCSKLSRLFRTGAGIIKQYDEATPDGLQMVFTTNVAGHYIMVRD